MELVFGLHAVEAVLRRSPAAIACLYAQAGRKDKRMRAITELAANQGVEVVALARYELDMKVAGRHQGVVARMAKTRNAEANNNGKGGKSKKADNAESMGKAKNTGKAGRAVSDGNVGRIGKDGKAVKDGQVGQAVKAEKEHTEAELRAQLESLEHPALLLVLDGITDPRNLGACLRSADAAGADAVIVPRSNAVGLTPAARKVACGAAETIPLIRVANLARALGHLKQRGIWLFGATADAPASLYDADLSAPLALVLGAEGAGLRRLTIEACDHLIRLPMRGAVPSLNVSVAAGICLYEAARQRSAARLCE